MYQVILADPPWWYNNRKTGGERKNKTKFGGGAQKYYDLMKAQEIAALDIPSIAAENCALFMWVTRPLLYDSVRRKPTWKPSKKWRAPHDVWTVLDAWGFRYCTVAFTWIKLNKTGSKPIFGPGYYTASNAEDCIIAVKGKMPPSVKMLPSIIMSPRKEHSRKPDLHTDIELMYPNKKRIELFSRRRYSGWDHWGNMVESDIVL